QSRSIPRNLLSNGLLRTWKFDHDSGRLALTSGFPTRRTGRRPGRLLATLLALFSMRAYGHGFGLRYDLPLPLGLWIIGAACAILLSFVIVAIAVRANDSIEAPAQANRLRWQIDSAVTGPSIRLIAQLFAVAALILIVVAG